MGKEALKIPTFRFLIDECELLMNLIDYHEVDENMFKEMKENFENNLFEGGNFVRFSKRSPKDGVLGDPRKKDKNNRKM